MRKIINIVITGLLLTHIAYSQNCGTKIPEGFFSMQKKMTSAIEADAEIPYQQLPNINLSISIYVSNGPFIDSIKIYDAIDSLNDAFEEIGVSFTACKILPVREKGFQDIDTDVNEEELFALYNTRNTINIYLARFVSVDGNAVCGYAYLPYDPPKDYIVISTECNIASVLIHEMGHFFGLLHPHETSRGKELVDGSNCESSGDLICDTEASPNLLELVSSNCEYTGVARDSIGAHYLPSVANYMSYSLKECRCMFTSGQYKRMIEYYWSFKTHLR